MKHLFYLAVVAIIGSFSATTNGAVITDLSIPQIAIANRARDLLNSEDRSKLAERMIPEYFQPLVANSSQQFFGSVVTGAYENVTQECRAHVGHWLTQLGKFEFWALEMIDAWGKFPEGILSGHTIVLGDFDECLSIRADVDIEDQLSSFKGKYCLSSIQSNFMPLGLQLGSCYPSSCTNDDILIFLQNIFQTQSVAHYYGCRTDEKPNYTAGDFAMIAGLGVLLTLCAIGTAIDLLLNESDALGKPRTRGFFLQVIIAFSVYTNTMKWLSTKSSGDNLGSIHGIRFFSTSWVVLCHTWAMIPTQPLWNFFSLLTISKESWLIYAILNGTVSVDTFFTLSGLLVAYGMLKTIDKAKGRLNVPMLYLHRYLRLTPAYAFLVGIMATWFVYLRTGPQWMLMEMSAEHCAKNWWHNLLYINNLIEYDAEAGDAMCHGEAWF